MLQICMEMRRPDSEKKLIRARQGRKLFGLLRQIIII